MDLRLRTEGTADLKISKVLTGNRIRNIPPCGAVPQATAPPLAAYGLYSDKFVTSYAEGQSRINLFDVNSLRKMRRKSKNVGVWVDYK